MKNIWFLGAEHRGELETVLGIHEFQRMETEESPIFRDKILSVFIRHTGG